MLMNGNYNKDPMCIHWALYNKIQNVKHITFTSYKTCCGLPPLLWMWLYDPAAAVAPQLIIFLTSTLEPSQYLLWPWTFAENPIATLTFIVKRKTRAIITWEKVESPHKRCLKVTVVLFVFFFEAHQAIIIYEINSVYVYRTETPRSCTG